MTTRQSHPLRPTTWRTRTAFWWIFLSALAIAVLAPMKYLTSSLQNLADRHDDFAANFAAGPPIVHAALYLHIVFAALALLLSPLQFAPRLRARVPRLHRVLGRVAFGSIGVAGCAGLVLAPGNMAGPIGTAGFGTLALLWVTFAAIAFRAIRRGDIATHRRWAIRTFALTYAAVTLRLWLVVLVPAQIALTGMDAQVAFDHAYHLVPFLGWVPNLIIAERYLAVRHPTRGNPSKSSTARDAELETLHTSSRRAER